MMISQVMATLWLSIRSLIHHFIIPSNALNYHELNKQLRTSSLNGAEKTFTRRSQAIMALWLCILNDASEWNCLVNYSTKPRSPILMWAFKCKEHTQNYQMPGFRLFLVSTYLFTWLTFNSCADCWWLINDCIRNILVSTFNNIKACNFTCT